MGTEQNASNTAATMLRTAVRAEQLLVRTPLALAAGVAASKLGRQSPVATTLERGVEALDAAAGKLLAAVDQGGSPAPRPEPQEPTAARPGAASADVDVAGPDEPLPAEEAEVVEHVAEELLEEQEFKPLAGELSEDDELRRVQAELHAKHLVEERQENPST